MVFWLVVGCWLLIVKLVVGLNVVVVSVVIVVVDDEFLLIDNLMLSDERLKLIIDFVCFYISF